MTTAHARRPRGRPSTGVGACAVAGALLLPLPGCERGPDGADVIQRGIEAHGGERFRDARVDFAFRGERWRIVRRDGRFRYERSYEDGDGRRVVEVMTNDSTARGVDGEPVDLDPEAVAEVELDVNSVVYFAFLPFRLDDPPVQARSLGADTIRGEPYHAVEVTFEQEGGGPDWEDRFVHWFHREHGTLDYLAYRYFQGEDRGEGGTRFREAVNRRERGGILVQDYVNSHVEGIDDIASYPDSLEAGALEHVSDVELEEVEVAHPADVDP